MVLLALDVKFMTFQYRKQGSVEVLLAGIHTGVDPVRRDLQPEVQLMGPTIGLSFYGIRSMAACFAKGV